MASGVKLDFAAWGPHAEDEWLRAGEIFDNIKEP